MSGTIHPQSCRVEIYQDSFMNGPAASFETTTPPLSVHVGDVLDPRQWPEVAPVAKPAAKNVALRVTAVNVLTWQMAGAPTGRSLSICVEAVARPQ